jgi:hypothetical protein
MATKIYDTATIELIDGTELYITPLKLKYLREFMDIFQNVKITEKETDTISTLVDCARVAMKQYYPLIKTSEDVEDMVDMPTIYVILDIAAGIKINDKLDEPVKEQAVDSGSSWDTLNLADLESEVFLLGIWKDYEDLETSISMPELSAILNVKREQDYADKKFSAAMQGVNLDEQTKKSNAWEDLKARVFSGGQATSGDDILAFQGPNAQKAGFGIGMGLSYEQW